MRALSPSHWSLALAALILAGCASAPSQPAVVTKTVNVEVPVHCSPNIGPEPSYADTPEAIRAASDFGSRLKLVLAGRVQRIQRLGELLAALKGCE